MARRKIIGVGRNCSQPPYIDSAASGVEVVAEMAAERKLAKYPISVENLGAFSLSTLEFLCVLGHKLSSYFSGEERASTSFSVTASCNV